MKKLILSLIVAAFVLPVQANEGMWFLMHIERLNYRDMQKMGLQLTPEEIYSVNQSSLKDAIVQFNRGCTAEMISDSGLVLTNHHCGYGQIAELSTAENDYLTNGFWAANNSEELKPKSLSVRFFVRMDDVSKRILALVNDNMTEADREATINKEIAKIEAENNEGGKFTVSVKSFFQGNEFYYFVYQDYNDVRLVGTPPASIGKFGGDTDNWEWPRHTGDFSLFRVYADKDGNPAEYSESNVPLKPKQHLTTSLKGFEENDFAMILGYPGRTNRWMPAGGIAQNVEYAYPAWVEASKTSMDVMKTFMDKDQQVKLDYASSYAGIANYWKNRQGMIDALKQHKTAESKRKDEKAFQKWASKKGNEKYADVIPVINNYYAKTNEISRHNNYLSLLIRTRMATLPYRLGNSIAYYLEQNEAKQAELKPKLDSDINDLYEGLYAPAEKAILAAQFKLYSTKAENPAPMVAAAAVENNKTDTGWNTYMDAAFKNSIFESKEKLEAFLANPDVEVLNNDPLFQLSNDLLTRYRYKSDEEKQMADNFEHAYRLLVQGMRLQNPDEKYYPDANSTLRLTYGKVISLPADKRNDATKNYYTTLKGTVAKYQPGDAEFDMPKQLIDLYEKKDFGQYADKDGYLPVNFLTDNDITGGNSGSPVLNGKGELIGLAFDGNIEAMAGDVIFDDQLQRTINVDIRYVLFLIDKYAGASHIIDELTLAK
ncbi:V8-like Glu-specific endopeptidase [Aequorivita sublithincola DSM 14238]|uniref:Dipeptidyl-peptidase n=1 Tax=Aequorivita sublithincola (strain DSM 14238 / LMG 21431 / ACAM 643 / 9-3) TaxID=746697 RepID=I3YWR0_AEQSU|nr:S46 family peptidase [Aequorivita sublithincola]AFL81428.1 V8-like Glu-specific endopeptidase [Aequorivita sublithincola DSM 14238]